MVILTVELILDTLMLTIELTQEQQNYIDDYKS